MSKENYVLCVIAHSETL